MMASSGREEAPVNKHLAMKERRSSLSLSGEFVFSRDQPDHAAKRRREEEEEEIILGSQKGQPRCSDQAEIAEWEAAMKRVEQITTGLMELIVANSNTKIEIKSAVRDLSRAVKNVRFRSGPPPRPIRHTADASSQCESTKSLRELDEAQRVWQKMAGSLSVDELRELIASNWPARAFRFTRYNRRSIANAPGNRIILLDPLEPKSKSLVKQLVTAHPSLTEILARAAPEGGKLIKVEYGETITIDEVTETAPRKCLWLGLMRKEDELEGLERMAGKMRAVIANNHEKVSVAAASLAEPQTLRKLLERELANSGMDSAMVEVCHSGVADISSRDGNQRQPGTGKKNYYETILVKGNGGETEKTYAEKVRELRAAIQPTKLGVQVQKVSQAANGDIRMLVKESATGGRANFMAELTKKAAAVGSTVETRVTKVRVMISDLDETTTQEEVSKAVADCLGVEEAELVVSAPRKSLNGGYWAAIQLPIRLSADLLKQNRVLVGWTNCRVQEMLRPANCSRCLQFGHVVRECKEPTTTERRCFRCNGAGHEAKNCKGEAYCGSCQEGGHRADSMACPKYRGLVQEIRERRGLRTLQ